MRRVLVGGSVALVACVLSLLPAGATVRTAGARSDSAIVTAGLLTISDFPPGWKESPSSSSSSSIDFSKYGKACARLQGDVNKVEKLRTAHGTSNDFQQDDAQEINNSVSVYRTAAGTSAALALLKRPAVVPCLARAVAAAAKKAEPAGVTNSTTFARLSVPEVGDDSIGYEIALTASGQGQTATVYVDFQLVRVGRAGLTFSFQGPDTSVLSSYQPLVQSVVQRVRTAEAGG